MTGLDVATLLLAATLAGGAGMTAALLRGAPRPPVWLSSLHGVLALAGVLVLGETALKEGIPPLAEIALALFLLGAAGGILLNQAFRRRQPPPGLWALGGHAALALLGFVLLLAAEIEVHS